MCWLGCVATGPSISDFTVNAACSPASLAVSLGLRAVVPGVGALVPPVLCTRPLRHCSWRALPAPVSPFRGDSHFCSSPAGRMGPCLTRDWEPWSV